MVFSGWWDGYEVGDLKGVCGVGLGPADGEVEPLVVAVSVGIVLHEQHIAVGALLLLKRTPQVAALEQGVQQQALPAALLPQALLVPFLQHSEAVVVVAIAAAKLDLVGFVRS